MNRFMQILRSDEGENSLMQAVAVVVSAILITAGLISFPSIINSAQESAARSVVSQIVSIQSSEIGKRGAYTQLGPDILRNGAIKGGSDFDETAAGCNSNATSCRNVAFIPGFNSADVSSAEQGQYNCYSVFVRTKSSVFYYQTRSIGSGGQTFKLGAPGSNAFPTSPVATQTNGKLSTVFPSGYSMCHDNSRGLPTDWWPATINDIPWG